jgi:hypothetical protein
MSMVQLRNMLPDFMGIAAAVMCGKCTDTAFVSDCEYIQHCYQLEPDATGYLPLG